MIGRTFLMEFRIGWKGLLIFMLLVMLVAGGIPQIYPTWKGSQIEELEGASRVQLLLPEGGEGNISLLWEDVEDAIGYVVLEDNSSHMVQAKIVYMGNATNITIPYDVNETRYYAVLATVNETSDPVLIGMASTIEVGSSPFEELLKNPAYTGFSGGRDIDFYELKGFLSFEFFSWWWMIAGMFIAYISVSIIASEFEGKRVDLIFSTPISRERFILEKYLSLVAISLLILLLAIGALIGGINSIGMTNEFGPYTVFLSLIGCLPFLLVIAAVGVLTAVVFQRTRIGMGLTFMFIFFEFLLYTVGCFSKDMEWLQSISIWHYWDYNSVLFDGVFNMGHFVGLFVLAGIILTIAILIFKKMDIPT